MKAKHKAANVRPKAAHIAPGSMVKQGSAFEEQIRLRAYQKYCARKGAAEDPLRDWLEAERELREVFSRREEARLSKREMVLLSAPKTDADNDPYC